ncbi:hypothetical protein CBER1_07453 [Cercospora berteroae]|uniref:BTB domain-containing protein n=1 Tax=Cercospora berteroae TaxID=357750 RepID=A0A2S6C7W9_9PEZI|nr:hypothetical protein CBER1_07453 [Cercospora berteroae]
MAPVSTTCSFPPRSAYDETVQVKIGPDPGAKVFTIPKGILIFYSGYFEGALRHSSPFTEARDGVFWLPDTDVDTWERFMVFLYRGEVDEDGANPLKVLCRLWVLADRREVPLLMNKCIDNIRKEVTAVWCSPAEVLPYVYANTAPGSALRRFVLLLSARAGQFAKVSPLHPSIAGYFDEESRRDLLQLIWEFDDERVWRESDVYDLDPCPEYHSHGPGEEDKCGMED